LSERSLSRRLRDRAEAALVAALAAFCRRLPPRATVRFGERLGGAVRHLDRRRRHVALANLELAYGAALTAAQRDAIARGVYRHLGRYFFECLMLFSHKDLRPFSSFVEFENLEVGRAALEQHGAVIIITPHQGNWELLGGALCERVTPLDVVVMPTRNPRLNERILALRADLGMTAIGREHAVPALFRSLRRGRSVGLLCDLNQKNGPDFADFFGVPAATVRTPGILAVRTGKPLVCVASWSTGEPLRYRAAFAPPIVPTAGADPDVEAHRIVVEMNRQLEAFVRAHPDQWNWIHPRWKTRPQR